MRGGGAKGEGRQGKGRRGSSHAFCLGNLGSPVKGTPETQNVSQKSSGDKNKEVGDKSTKFKFGQLILRKIIKIVATRSHTLNLKCTKFDFG